jgi:hypothetical protein
MCLRCRPVSKPGSFIMNDNIAVIQYPSPRQRRRFAVAAAGIMLILAAGVAVWRTSHMENLPTASVVEGLNPARESTLTDARPAALIPEGATGVPQLELPRVLTVADVCTGGLGWACIFTSVPELPSVVTVADVCTGGLGWACIFTPQLPDQR